MPAPQQLSIPKNVPVVSYPTPNIGDHILVEYVDGKGPNSDPLPLGTAHPNTVKYPNHFLVLQKPFSEDGKIVQRVYANPRVNEDSYNWALKWSGEHSQYPIAVRTYLALRASYTRAADLSPDPDDDKRLLVHEETEDVKQTDHPELDGLFIKVTRVYETIPGPPVVSMAYDERGDLETTITQTVLNTDDPPVEQMNYLFNGAQTTGGDALKSTRVTKTVTQRTPLWTETQASENRVLNLHFLTGTKRTTKDEIVPVGTDPASGFLVVESVVKDVDRWKSRRLTTQIDEWPTKQSYTVDPRAHGSTTITTQTVVEVGTEAEHPEPGGRDVIESSVENVDQLRSNKTVTKLAPDETWPVLVQDDVDPTTGIVIRVTRQVVSPADGISGVLTDGGFYEVQPTNDKWRSIQICSKLKQGSLPADETWTGSRAYRFEDVLDSIGIDWNFTQETGSGASGVLHSALDFPEGVSWECAANAEASSGLTANVWQKIICGYAGPVKTVFTRHYQVGPPSDNPNITIITPVRGIVSVHSTGFTVKNSVAYRGYGSNGFTQQQGFGSRVSADGHEVNLGPFLHNGPVLQNADPLSVYPNLTVNAAATSGSTPEQGSYPATGAAATAKGVATMYLPASTTPPASGTSYVVDVRPVKWRFNIWVVETETVYHP